jgi:hypothetical protein
MITYGEIYDGVFAKCGLSTSAATLDDMMISIALPGIFRREVEFRLASEGRLSNPSYPLEIQHVVRHALDVAKHFKVSPDMLNHLFNEIIKKAIHSASLGSVSVQFFKSRQAAIVEGFEIESYKAYVKSVKDTLARERGIREAKVESFNLSDLTFGRSTDKVMLANGEMGVPVKPKPRKDPKPEVSATCKKSEPKLVFGKLNVVKSFGTSM